MAMAAALQSSVAVDVADEVKSRSAEGAAAKLGHFGGGDIAAALARLSPGFAQDVLDALPEEARERALLAAAPELARQWQRNSRFAKEAIGRMMEPVVAAYPPAQTLAETIDKLRELVKTTFITYVYVVDASGRLLGIVTMRDLLFNDTSSRLEQVMLRNVFSLRATTPLMD